MVRNRTHCYCQYLSVYTEKFPSPLFPSVCVCAFHAAQLQFIVPLITADYPSMERRGGGLMREKFDVREEKRKTEGGERWKRREEMIMHFKILQALKREEGELEGDKEIFFLYSFFVTLSCLLPFCYISLLFYLCVCYGVIFISYSLAGCQWKCQAMFDKKGVDGISSLFPKRISGKNSKFKCRHMKQDKILLIPSDVLLKILSLQVELHMNETTKEVNTTVDVEVFLWYLSYLEGIKGNNSLYSHSCPHLIKHCTDGNRNKLSF